MSDIDRRQLRKESVGTAHIVFFVVAAAAPLTAVLGASPAAFAFGNGPGVPAVYILVGLLYLLFSAGFTAMSRYVQSASGFYAYVVSGLGRPAGAVVAAVALTSYQAIALGAYGLFGFFASQSAARAGFHLSWWLAVLPLLAFVQFCGQRAVTFGGNILGVCMMGEIAILVALCCAILAVNTTPLAVTVPPASIFGRGLGIAIVFVVASFIGFEATVIFGEEAKEPALTIPRATYIAVILIAIFYGLCTWSVSIYYGAAKISAAAARDPGNLYLRPISALLGPRAQVITQALLLTSLFACVLSFHSTIARYLFSMAAEGFAPLNLGRIHVVHGSPHVAGMVQTLATLVMVAFAALGGVDPFAGLFAWAGTFASLGVLTIQILTSFAVFQFFRCKPGTTSFLKGTVAPLAAALGLTACLALAIVNLPLIAGSASHFVFLLPAGIILAALDGWAAGLVLPHPANTEKLLVPAIAESER